jgi:hypothetical protein
MKTARFVQLKDDDQFELMKAFKICCCDCGLVHTWEIENTEDGIMVNVKRDNRATAQLRRRNKYLLTK